MVEVAGDLSVTFRVKNALDLQHIFEICQQFDGQPIITKSRPRKERTGERVSREEMQEKVIQLLKATFRNEGFDMKEAAAVAEKKLNRRKKTVWLAVKLATEKGVLQRKGRLYAFTEFIQKRIAAKLQEQSNELMPIASSPGGPSP